MTELECHHESARRIERGIRPVPNGPQLQRRLDAPVRKDGVFRQAHIQKAAVDGGFRLSASIRKRVREGDRDVSEQPPGKRQFAAHCIAQERVDFRPPLREQ